MYGSKIERLACYVLAVQIYFSTPAEGFVHPAVSRSSLYPQTVLSALEDSTGVNGSLSFGKSSSFSKERTLYEILEASPTSTRDELKKKYVELAKLSHPDAQIGMLGITDAPDFGEIAAAWRVLGDSKSRRRYDRELQYKEWAESASKYANEKMEEAVPAVAKIMDDLALPFLRRTAATTVAVSQAVSNIALGDSTPKEKDETENRNYFSVAFMNAIRAGQKAGRAIDTLELNEKSAELLQR
jgi:DnaJ domain